MITKMEIDYTMIQVLIIWIAATALIVSLISIGRETDITKSIVVTDNITNNTTDYTIDQDNALKMYSSQIVVSEDAELDNHENIIIGDEKITFNSAGTTKVFEIHSNAEVANTSSAHLDINYKQVSKPILQLKDPVYTGGPNATTFFDTYVAGSGDTAEVKAKLSAEFLANIKLLKNEHNTNPVNYNISVLGRDNNNPMVFYKDPVDDNDNDSSLYVFANNTTPASTDHGAIDQAAEGFFIKPSVKTYKNDRTSTVPNSKDNKLSLGFYQKENATSNEMNNNSLLDIVVSDQKPYPTTMTLRKPQVTQTTEVV